MQWICFAIRPLTLEELRITMVVDADTSHTSVQHCKNTPEYAKTNEDMEKRICDLSRRLAEVGNHGVKKTVQLVHQSVNDFLLDRGFRLLGNLTTAEVAGQSHFRLSRSCIRFLSMTEIIERSAFLGREGGCPIEIFLEKFPFLEYSAQSWIQHAVNVENAGLPQSDLLSLFNVRSDGTLKSWHKIMMYSLGRCDRADEGGSILNLASKYGLLSVIKAAIRGDFDMDVKGSDGRTPLSHAAEEGHETVAKPLLGLGDVNAGSKDERGRTPLSWEAEGGREKLVSLLLDRTDVEVNLKDDYGLTPLALAAHGCHETVVKLLLDRVDVEVNSKRQSGQTPLSEAARQRHTGVVKLLIGREDIDVNLLVDRGMAPLP